MRRYTTLIFLGILFLSASCHLSAQFSSSRLIFEFELNQPADVATADVDGDGKRDILVAASLNRVVSWYRNHGDGEFGPQQIIG